MNRVSQGVMRAWVGLGPRFLPFADAATPDLPLSRLLRLSLFQVAVGMALVLLIGTLNRVMIVELKVPASLVGIMISLPLIFAPFRALIGFRSDNHRSSLGFGAFLADFTPGRLVQVIQGAAVATIVFNGIALWKQEARNRAPRAAASQHAASFRQAWVSFTHGGQAVRRLVAVGFGTMAFSMEDVLLEPYGGQVLHLTVGDTTKLTATLALGGLFGFGLASRVLSRGADPFRMACYGALVGIPAFAAVIIAAPLSSALLFGGGTFLIGFGAGLFGHGTLTATMNLAPPDQTGLALGAWGAVQASAAGLAIALGGILRDVVATWAQAGSGAALGYDCVYILEIVLLFATLVVMFPLMRRVAAYA